MHPLQGRPLALTQLELLLYGHKGPLFPTCQSLTCDRLTNLERNALTVVTDKLSVKAASIKADTEADRSALSIECPPPTPHGGDTLHKAQGCSESLHVTASNLQHMLPGALHGLQPA